jgi:hypothetical protein
LGRWPVLMEVLSSGTQRTLSTEDEDSRWTTWVCSRDWTHSSLMWVIRSPGLRPASNAGLLAWTSCPHQEPGWHISNSWSLAIHKYIHNKCSYVHTLYSSLVQRTRASDEMLVCLSPMQDVQGSSPFRDKDFQVHTWSAQLLGVGDCHILQMRSSLCTHSEHQVRTIKILQSLCISNEIVENIQ